jgi:hypothetical protein
MLRNPAYAGQAAFGKTHATGTPARVTPTARHLAEERPLLITVDDAHWADPPSLRWLHYLAARLDGLPILVAIASRPPEVDGADEGVFERPMPCQFGTSHLGLRAIRHEASDLPVLPRVGVSVARVTLPEASEAAARGEEIGRGSADSRSPRTWGNRSRSHPDRQPETVFVFATDESKPNTADRRLRHRRA